MESPSVPHGSPTAQIKAPLNYIINAVFFPTGFRGMQVWHFLARICRIVGIGRHNHGHRSSSRPGPPQQLPATPSATEGATSITTCSSAASGNAAHAITVCSSAANGYATRSVSVCSYSAGGSTAYLPSHMVMRSVEGGCAGGRPLDLVSCCSLSDYSAVVLLPQHRPRALLLPCAVGTCSSTAPPRQRRSAHRHQGEAARRMEHSADQHAVIRKPGANPHGQVTFTGVVGASRFLVKNSNEYVKLSDATHFQKPPSPIRSSACAVQRCTDLR